MFDIIFAYGSFLELSEVCEYQVWDCELNINSKNLLQSK